MTTDITGYQLEGFSNGGSANKGQDVSIVLRVFDGTQHHDLSLFIAHDKLPQVIAGLATFGGMARNTRLAKNPMEEADGTFAGAHALPLRDIVPARSITDPSIAILTLQLEAIGDRTLNFYLAADAEGLGKIRTACDHALGQLQQDPTGSQTPSLN